MARYHCDKVSEQLQQVEGVRVTNVTQSSWTFQQDSARINLRVLPGCCGVLLAYNLSGDQKALNRLLKHICRAAGKANFGVVLISLRSDSTLRGLLGAEWTSTKFNNPRTHNDVELLSYTIPKPVRVKKYPKPVEDQ